METDSAQNRSKVADGVAKCHPTVAVPSSPPVSPTKEKSTPSTTAENGWASFTPLRIRQRRASITPMDAPAAAADNDDDSDSDSGDEEQERARTTARGLDRELAIMRRVFGKWSRRAGVRATACDSLPEEEMGEVGWTRAIAPRVEGRIRNVTEIATGGS